MKKPIMRVLICDDHEFLLDGIEVFILREPGMELVGKAKSGQELINLAKELHPDIVITDLRMPDMDGISAVRELNSLQPTPGSIILSMFADDYHVIEAAKAGVLGYVTKGAPRTELAEAIRAVSRGESYYCPAAGGKLADYFSRKKTEANENEETQSSLTEEEKAIIRMMVEGKDTNEIAKTLFKSRAYVNEARIRIRRKIGGNHLADIIRWAIRHGLVDS